MKTKIEIEMSVGLTPQMREALEIATTFQGSNPSQYTRQAVVERLVREGFLEHPGQKYATAANATATAK